MGSPAQRDVATAPLDPPHIVTQLALVVKGYTPGCIMRTPRNRNKNISYPGRAPVCLYPPENGEPDV